MNLKRCLNCNKIISRKKYVCYIKVKFCCIECSNIFRDAMKIQYDKFKKNNCEVCDNEYSVGFENNIYSKSLSVHHKDFNSNNNNSENLITVCKNCHSNFHKKK